MRESVLHRHSRVLPRRERGPELCRRMRELLSGMMGKNQGLLLLSENRKKKEVDAWEVTRDKSLEHLQLAQAFFF